MRGWRRMGGWVEGQAALWVGVETLELEKALGKKVESNYKK